MTNRRSRVLVVEDHEEFSFAIKRVLTSTYEVELAKNTTEAISIINNNWCDLILLDVILPGRSGLWLCEQIKSDVRLRHIPVIFLSGMDTPNDIVKGLRSGGDDYLEKPFHMEELLARTETAIRRSEMTLNANPLSRLPGNGLIEREIIRRLESKKLFSILYIDISHFKAYNDYYGFLRGDKVLLQTTEAIISCCAGNDRMLGHIGGDDFIVVIGEEDAAPICEKLINRFDDLLSSFYDEDDFKAGHISIHDRKGVLNSFPLISLAIGVVTNKVRILKNIGEISTIAAQVKYVAKRQEKSAYFIDRRVDEYPPPKKNPNEKTQE
ncbi:MAG: response regulator [Elusimicrobiota bacterium]